MNTKSNRPTHIYTFYNPPIHICVKACDLADAIDTLRLQFGYEWVQRHIDDYIDYMEVSWYKPNKK